ncbi:protein CUP-SHAPED COTYLEDON 1-like [Trifolium pratense]|uniref:protein CUP-SHAPED COTYLEDON 1-like n=1 Tax=Trifolium pratense TaxID=57577 RepID=UPI001E692477|nr:protein CUP-SHAPED COTYLEDON 1-like [Trifolium pratense]
MPIGYRFHPTEEELVGHYLEHKLAGNDSIVSNITEVNLNSIEPWELPVMLALSKTTSDDSEWYFFTTDDLKYKTSTRCIRTTNAGYWKKTGITREIKIKGTNNVIGTKKIFVFYKHYGSHIEKTNWIIHQYHAINVPDNKRNFVLCRLMEKTEVVRDELMYDEGASNHVAAGAELESIADLTPNVCGSPEVTMQYNLLASPHEDDYSFPEATNQTYFEGLTSSNAHFKTENSNAGFAFETDQEVKANYNSFLDSDSAVGEVYISYETSQNAPAFVDDSTA